MRISAERIRPPLGGRKTHRIKGEDDPRFKHTHYSNKAGHLKRSDHHPEIKHKKAHR